MANYNAQWEPEVRTRRARSCFIDSNTLIAHIPPQGIPIINHFRWIFGPATAQVPARTVAPFVFVEWLGDFLEFISFLCLW